jgi:hypothetical protein
MTGAFLLALLLAQAVGAQTAAAPLPAASAEAALTVRPEIGVLLQDAQRLLGEKKGAEASDKLAAAEAVENKSAYERHILARLKIALAGLTGNAELAAQQVELASQGPWSSPADKLAGLQSVAGLYYNAKNYAKAIEWTARYQQAGGLEPGMNTLLAQSYYLAADYTNAARVLEAEVGKTSAAGKVPPEMQLRLLVDSHGRLKDEAAYRRSLESLVQHYPSQANWRALLARLWARPQLATRLHLHLFRLQSGSAGFSEASEYTEMAELALQEGSAFEAAKVLEQGYASGLLSAGERSLQVLGDKVAKSVAEDRKTLEADVARAAKLPDGLALFNYGFNLYQSGQSERGVAQMEQALAKGIARNNDLVRLRLVAVYAQLKDRTKALQLLSGLAGKPDPVGLEDIVRYWQLFLRQT